MAAPGRRSPGLPPEQAKQAGAAAQDAFVYALSHAMGICAVVTLLGAVVGVAAIRARRGSATLEAAEAPVSPGGSEVAAGEAISA